MSQRLAAPASPSDPVAQMREAIDEMALALSRKADRLRAAVADLDGLDVEASGLEVLSVLAEHDVRVTEDDLSLHAAVQEAAHALIYPAA